MSYICLTLIFLSIKLFLYQMIKRRITATTNGKSKDKKDKNKHSDPIDDRIHTNKKI